ncbi:MAG: c-type cytochrome [Pyrinomonadaceae bacterium]
MSLRILKVAIVGLVALIFAVFEIQRATMQTKQVETAGEKFKNIKVLNEMPADQMGKVMSMMSASLGVECGYCHINADFASDENKKKEEAREMLRMTFEINKQFFKGRPEISCNSCHNGAEHPASASPLLPPVAHSPRPAQPDPKPSGEEIVANYRKMLGAPKGTRYIKAQRLEPNGAVEPEEIWVSGNKMRIETKYGDTTVIDGFDGTNPWKATNKGAIALHSTEAQMIRDEASFYNGEFLNSYTKFEYRFTGDVEGKPANLVIATTADGTRNRLYFDAKTGLLLRYVMSTPTVIGAHVVQVDLRDYKKAGGGLVPMTLKFAMPNVYWTRKILSVKDGILIDDGKFVK